MYRSAFVVIAWLVFGAVPSVIEASFVTPRVKAIAELASVTIPRVRRQTSSPEQRGSCRCLTRTACPTLPRYGVLEDDIMEFGVLPPCTEEGRIICCPRGYLQHFSQSATGQESRRNHKMIQTLQEYFQTYHGVTSEVAKQSLVKTSLNPRNGVPCLPQSQCRVRYGIHATDVATFGRLSRCPPTFGVRCLVYHTFLKPGATTFGGRLNTSADGIFVVLIDLRKEAVPTPEFVRAAVYRSRRGPSLPPFLNRMLDRKAPKLKFKIQSQGGNVDEHDFERLLSLTSEEYGNISGDELADLLGLKAIPPGTFTAANGTKIVHGGQPIYFLSSFASPKVATGLFQNHDVAPNDTFFPSSGIDDDSPEQVGGAISGFSVGLRSIILHLRQLASFILEGETEVTRVIMQNGATKREISFKRSEMLNFFQDFPKLS